jgi:hypothetical protein
MPGVGFEPTTPVFKRVKTIHALDCAATVTGVYIAYRRKMAQSREGFKKCRTKFTSTVTDTGIGDPFQR